MPFTRSSATAILALLAMPILASSQSPQPPSSINIPSDAAIRKMLAERVDTLAGQDDSIGMIIGIVTPQGRRLISYGHRDHGDPRPLDGDTAFEIASVTKVFTALLLADMDHPLGMRRT